MSPKNIEVTFSIVRILKADGTTAGTGFVASESLIVTCAHVVEVCGAGPSARVNITFHANGQECEAEVLPDYWRPADVDDIAFLRLLFQDEPLPTGVIPVTLGMTRACNGHKMRTLGSLSI